MTAAHLLSINKYINKINIHFKPNTVTLLGGNIHVGKTFPEYYYYFLLQKHLLQGSKNKSTSKDTRQILKVQSKGLGYAD